MLNFIRRIIGQKTINLYHLIMAFFANVLYSFPSRKLHMIGVTGTDGKTTTVNLLASILRAGRLKTSFLTSINAQIGEEHFDTGLHTTTPSPFLLQRLLRKMVQAGSRYAVIEVTSHALDQHRVWGINFETAVITNVTPEHLDYHQTYEEYLRAKAKLFGKARVRVLNKSDKSYNFLLSMHQSLTPASPAGGPTLSAIGEGEKPIITYNTPGADLYASDTREELGRTSFLAHTPRGPFPVNLKIPGKFNIANSLAAIAVGLTYNVSTQDIKSGLESVTGVSGRMEFINEGQKFYAMVDFAHTPNAIRELLSALRPQVSGKIIIVFGSAGGRDRQKRPAMGEAASVADIVVITREDNRSEKVEDICRQIVSGIIGKKLNEDLFVIPGRREAIRFALQKARAGDLVVATGKGHEQSLNVDGVELSWDDRKVMKEELQVMQNAKIKNQNDNSKS